MYTNKRVEGWLNMHKNNNKKSNIYKKGIKSIYNKYKNNYFVEG